MHLDNRAILKYIQCTILY